jgi:hypothetical protein
MFKTSNMFLVWLFGVLVGIIATVACIDSIKTSKLCCEDCDDAEQGNTDINSEEQGGQSNV